MPMRWIITQKPKCGDDVNSFSCMDVTGKRFAEDVYIKHLGGNTGEVKNSRSKI